MVPQYNPPKAWSPITTENGEYLYYDMHTGGVLLISSLINEVYAILTRN